MTRISTLTVLYCERGNERATSGFRCSVNEIWTVLRFYAT